MALTSTLYRFRIDLSDVDRGLYRDFDLRLARHPSENEAYLLTRLFAYLLEFDDGMELAPGLCADDEPAIFVRDAAGGGFAKWIEIGNPSARRLHKASKAARDVSVYTYKDPANLVRELAGEKVHRIESIRAYAIASSFLDPLARLLGRDNSWTVFRQDGELTLVAGEESLTTPLEPVQLTP